MTSSDKLFASRLAFSVCLTLLVLVVYVIFTTYTDQIQDEVARVLTDSFGHLGDEVAKL